MVALRGSHRLTPSSLTATWGYAPHTPQADVSLTTPAPLPNKPPQNDKSKNLLATVRRPLHIT